jgi:hypothetical protein
VLGPRAVDDPPEVRSILARRYRCRRCGAVVVVVPEGVGRRIAYGVVAIVLALGRWAVDGRPAREVRAEVSPFAIVGATAASGWRSLGRWTRTVERLFPGVPQFIEPTCRARARRVLAFAASFAPRTTGALLVDALQGAARAARWTSEA